MTTRLILFFLILTPGHTFSQVPCDSLGFDKDTLATLDGKLYSGHCFSYTKNNVIRRHMVAGCVDTIVFMDKKLRLETVETVTKCSDVASYKSFYKNGVARQFIEMKDGECFGFWREYYKNGKIKYEAEYGDNTKIKNDTYYSWDKKGHKYLNSCSDKSKTKKIGKFRVDYELGVGRCKRTLIKNAT